MKSFLIGHGMTPSELKSHRKFGHNLAALLEEAQKRNLEDEVLLDQQEVGVIKLLTYDYLEKRLEYRVTGGKYCLP
ncbi:MAG: hypothetical protein NT159_00430 [Proteobacteria bacterium]|nr:hypothetical protein [Pseudomonadota bacterium]